MQNGQATGVPDAASDTPQIAKLLPGGGATVARRAGVGEDELKGFAGVRLHGGGAATSWYGAVCGNTIGGMLFACDGAGDARSR